MEPIKQAVTEIHHMFVVLNKHFFENELQQPALLIQTNGRKKSSMGWCSKEKIWHGHQTHLYEITICGEYLYRPLEELTGTLLHEMVHLYNIQNGIKDVSRSGYYHNKSFKNEAERRGLIVEKAPGIGWSVTTLRESTKEWLIKKPFDKSAFSVARTGVIDEEKDPDNDYNKDDVQKKKRHVRKYVCPSCGSIVRATRKVRVMCADCNKLFICTSHEEKEDEGE